MTSVFGTDRGMKRTAGLKMMSLRADYTPVSTKSSPGDTVRSVAGLLEPLWALVLTPV